MEFEKLRIIDDGSTISSATRSLKSSSRDSSLSSRSSSRTGKIKSSRTKRTHVLHFLKDILDDTSMEYVARWENKEEGVFQIVDRERTLELWNETKSKPTKNWNNFV